ncbi:TIGR03085 family protein [Mycobacterium sp. MS1601]|uniref:TIGR03085 family metal-binding protein n=1 Tax=Mycobacterium sp. MS1601 TaxID=1936029 RepID=UPI00097968B0|nr:TIGR03085 family metal-binding protein [Mycobacterium sp. MS1601]AQA06068.1 TIGR03085 family protein [Mycobacterium sp. MS1601]
MTVAKRERAALVDTFRAVGADAPTLCEGWTTRDLAAHLVLRERRLDATPGIAFPPLQKYTAKVQDRIAESTPYPELVDKLAGGPPIYSPFAWVDPLVNVSEMFVHHEDVRRAQPDWEPRQLDSATVAALLRPFGMLSRVALAKVPARLILRTADGRTLATVGKGPEVILTGAPEELVLFAFGRDAVRIEFTGDDDAVAAVKAAKRGI